MTSAAVSAVQYAPQRLLDLRAPLPPAWVRKLLAASSGPVVHGVDGLRVRIDAVGALRFASITVPGAADLADAPFRAAVARSYRALLAMADELRRAPVRFWNYVPDLRRPSRDGFTRYEVFNAGRHDGFAPHAGDHDFRPHLPTSSGVGHRGDDFVVQVLMAPAAGAPVENPRQTPAYRYSRRYGELPPCFSRATLLAEPISFAGVACRGLVAGTASIEGEHTVHPDDLEAQLEVTLHNLRAIARAVGAAAGGAEAGLGSYRDLRVYVSDPRFAGAVVRGFEPEFPRLAHIEIAVADICRRGLLMEAEGIVTLDD
jgi:chorismate lyase/3-hydroxybenzoate synthase